jgi:hypothetical protein
MPYKNIEDQRRWRIKYNERITGKKRKFTRKVKEMSEEQLKDRLEKIKKAHKKYNKKNKEKIAKYYKKYREENKEEIKKKAKTLYMERKKARPSYKLYLKYKERMMLYFNIDLSEDYYKKWISEHKKKLSKICLRKKRRKNSPFWVLMRDTLSKEEFKKWSKKNNNKKKREFNRKNRRSNVKFLKEYKLTHPCVKCGEKDPSCLNFHHMDKFTKKYDIYNMKKCSQKLIIEEITKCEIICVNCHAKLHNNSYENLENKIEELTILLKEKLTPLERRKVYRDRQKLIGKQYVQNYKNTHSCQECNESNPICLCFHHINKEEKEGNISVLYKYGMPKLKAEIAKCIILCGNCHSKLHFTKNS